MEVLTCYGEIWPDSSQSHDPARSRIWLVNCKAKGPSASSSVISAPIFLASFLPVEHPLSSGMMKVER